MKGVSALAWLVFAGLALAGVPTPLVAAPKPAPAGNRCDFRGWSEDPDPNGQNIRKEPAAGAPVLARLPGKAYSTDFERDFFAEFEIVEARNGWFRIANVAQEVRDGYQQLALPSGWISGRFIRFSFQTEKGFATPSPKSAVIWRSSDWSGPPDIQRITDCRGKWAQLEYRQGGKTIRAWFRGICGNQETSCDGVVGD